MSWFGQAFGQGGDNKKEEIAAEVAHPVSAEESAASSSEDAEDVGHGSVEPTAELGPQDSKPEKKNPFDVLGGAFGAIGGALGEVAKHGDKLKSAVGSKADEYKIGEKFDELKGGLGKAAGEKIEDLKKAGDGLQKATGEKLEDFKKISGEKMEDLKKVGDGFQTATGEKLEDLKKASGEKIEDLKKVGDGLQKATGEKLEDLKKASGEKIEDLKKVGDGLQKATGETFEGLKRVVAKDGEADDAVDVQAPKMEPIYLGVRQPSGKSNDEEKDGLIQDGTADPGAITPGHVEQDGATLEHQGAPTDVPEVAAGAMAEPKAPVVQQEAKIKETPVSLGVKVTKSTPSGKEMAITLGVKSSAEQKTEVEDRSSADSSSDARSAEQAAEVKEAPIARAPAVKKVPISLGTKSSLLSPEFGIQSSKQVAPEVKPSASVEVASVEVAPEVKPSAPEVEESQKPNEAASSSGTGAEKPNEAASSSGTGVEKPNEAASSSASGSPVRSEAALPQSFGKCWRCGQQISLDVEAFEEHSLKCQRPSVVENDTSTEEPIEEIMTSGSEAAADVDSDFKIIDSTPDSEQWTSDKLIGQKDKKDWLEDFGNVLQKGVAEVQKHAGPKIDELKSHAGPKIEELKNASVQKAGQIGGALGEAAGHADALRKAAGEKIKWPDKKKKQLLEDGSVPEGSEGIDEIKDEKYITPDLDPGVVFNHLQHSVEKIVIMTLEPVLNGIPQLHIPPVSTEARRLLADHEGDVEAAIASVKEAVDKEAHNNSMVGGRIANKVGELLVSRFLPVVGVGAYLSHALYVNLRRSALIAELYGHDTKSPEVQGQLLFCLLPDTDGPGEKEAEQRNSPANPEDTGPKINMRGPLERATKSLARVLARQTMKRATGWKAAADLFDLAAAIVGEFTTLDQPLPEDSQQAALRRAVIIFKPSRVKAPHSLMLLAFGASMPVLANIVRHLKRISLLIFPLPSFYSNYLAGALFVLLCLFAWFAKQQLEIQCVERPQLIPAVVFFVHAALPVLATFDATGLLWAGSKRLGGFEGERSEGFLLCLLGVWCWVRTWLRCSGGGDRSLRSAQGLLPTLQLILLFAILSFGLFDLLGQGGIGAHDFVGFGVTASHHWLFGMIGVVALECQMRLVELLRHREVLLRVIGATQMMSLSIFLFLGGMSAAVGFFVSRNEFQAFVDNMAPPPLLAAVVLRLRADRCLWAMAFGATLAVQWNLEVHNAMLQGFCKAYGLSLGAAAVGLVFATFEANRQTLTDPSGARWLLLMPETTEATRQKAQVVLQKMKIEGAEMVVEGATHFLGKGILDKIFNSFGQVMDKPLEKGVELAAEVVEVADKVEQATGAA